MRIAVIENEFGQENIDNEILVQESREQIVEMNNGCICCTVRGDLIIGLTDLAKKRAAGEIQFDRVVIETTGLANPGPVAQTFFMDEEVGSHYLLDAIVTVVDARHAMQRNNTIIGLSDAMIVIESGTTGGTHACAEAAMRIGHPLFVAEYAAPADSAEGNKSFVESTGVLNMPISDTFAVRLAYHVEDRDSLYDSIHTNPAPGAFGLGAGPYDGDDNRRLGSIRLGDLLARSIRSAALAKPVAIANRVVRIPMLGAPGCGDAPR